MTPAELERLIASHNLPPLLYLYGEETFTLERLLKRLIHSVIPADATDFNLTVMHHKEFTADKLLDTARTYPVFCSHRVVVVKDAHQLPATELDRILPYVLDPAPETILVFSGEKIDARKKFFVEFKKHGELVECKKLYENQLPAVIRSMAQAEGYTLTEDAMVLFSRRVGANLQDIHTELLKLGAYICGRNLADSSDVSAVVTSSRQETVFSLNDALGDKDTSRAVEMIGRLLNEGTPALVVLSMMVRHFRNLWKIREMLDQNRNRGELAKAAAVNPYFLDGLIRQARNFPPKHLRTIFEDFVETDLALKSAGAHPGALLEKTAMLICAQ